MRESCLIHSERLLEVIYLFADASAKGFYEKCGYIPITEKNYHLQLNRGKMEALKDNYTYNIRKSDIDFKPLVGDESLIEVSDKIEEDGITFIKMNREIEFGDIRFPGLSHA